MPYCNNKKGVPMTNVPPPEISLRGKQSTPIFRKWKTRRSRWRAHVSVKRFRSKILWQKISES